MKHSMYYIIQCLREAETFAEDAEFKLYNMFGESGNEIPFNIRLELQKIRKAISLLKQVENNSEIKKICREGE